jgi:hypothetical protein
VSHRWNIETTGDGIRICEGLHERSEPCEWTEYVPRDSVGRDLYAPRPIRSGDPIATGTGAARRRLTLEEAAAGGLPERFTPEEWAAMARASNGET